MTLRNYVVLRAIAAGRLCPTSPAIRVAQDLRSEGLAAPSGKSFLVTDQGRQALNAERARRSQPQARIFRNFV